MKNRKGTTFVCVCVYPLLKDLHLHITGMIISRRIVQESCSKGGEEWTQNSLGFQVSDILLETTF